MSNQRWIIKGFEFENDLAEYYKVTNHEKRDKIWNFAREQGEDDGFTDIAEWYEIIIDLVL